MEKQTGKKTAKSDTRADLRIQHRHAFVSPSQVAACKRAARARNVSTGNEFADKTAQAAAQGHFESIATIQRVPQPTDRTIQRRASTCTRREADASKRVIRPFRATGLAPSQRER